MKKIYRVYPARVIMIYKQIRENPLKTWIAKDFNISTNEPRRILELLASLGIVERVPVMYATGFKYQARKEVKGYRLRIK
jgi:predicted RNA methylase